ncbi:MAG: mechanosensitive ion channel family protein [Clostridiales bacterium]|nr:mechanosensitive ion channel family protein [Clostridiales bacterium]MDY4060507.1 mechanosensitive ion channel family protein [Anaerovoracaceae bacterium]
MQRLEKLLETTYGGMIVMALGILIVGLLVMKLLLYLSERLLSKSGLDLALHGFILVSEKILLWVILIIIILSALNVPTVPLVTLLGATGAAIALALRDSLSNVAAGLIILFSKPILKGEIVEIEEKKMLGIVDAIDLMTTHLHSFDNKKITVPNSLIVNSVVLNYSREPKRRVDCVATISYDADIDKAKQLLLQIAISCPGVLQNEEIIIGVNALGEDGVVLDVKAWCPTDSYFDVKYYIEEHIKLTFDKSGIEIPYRKLDVNLRDMKGITYGKESLK